MNWRNTSTRYGNLSMGMHWLMLGLIAAVYACIELRGYFPRGSGLRQGMKNWHFMLGLSVWLLLLLRLALRLTDTAPRIEPPPVKWQSLAATAMHLALYGLMLLMPLLGWMTLSAKGKSLPYFFGFQLPPFLPSLLPPSEAAAELLEELHETGGNIGYVLIGLHATAALYHHYIVRDNTLLRMLPRSG
ncbi:cytochrome b [Roseateles oligotrophus]|uniref:Cytochrome b n=1 Tax=Roseateles oligotrophus TaxID=1769250 RepID=A0ABT2YD47_9BURK|nr:cytochrome b [Roseateles oligotrophus]MCV2367963.1 cytochrome b [Roseateles oligotrophus]